MCTVTFIPKSKGYRLAMNRDEQLARVTGIPPQMRDSGGRRILCPSEPGGGTWISVNDFGACLALINWYSIKERVKTEPLSRGEIINLAGASDSASAVDTVLASAPLKRVNPFRLIGVFPSKGEIVEWRWNLRELDRTRHRWKPRQWISSGYDEPGAQRARGKIFRKAERQPSAHAASWLRRLHRSHEPGRGPYSTCMHRSDAATVSCTEVAVTARAAQMLYHAGPPCTAPAGPPLTLTRSS